MMMFVVFLLIFLCFKDLESLISPVESHSQVCHRYFDVPDPRDLGTSAGFSCSKRGWWRLDWKLFKAAIDSWAKTTARHHFSQKYKHVQYDMRSWCPERHQQGPKWTTETFDIHQQHQQPEVGTSLSLAYGPMGVAFVSTDLLRSGCSAMNCPSKSCTLLSTYSMPLKAIELFTKRKNHSAQHSLSRKIGLAFNCRSPRPISAPNFWSRSQDGAERGLQSRKFMKCQGNSSCFEFCILICSLRCLEGVGRSRAVRRIGTRSQRPCSPGWFTTDARPIPGPQARFPFHFSLSLSWMLESLLHVVTSMPGMLTGKKLQCVCLRQSPLKRPCVTVWSNWANKSNRSIRRQGRYTIWTKVYFICFVY